MSNTRKLTILHSNDLHGDFLAQETDNALIGGVSMLSGYINMVRNECENTLYVISGDMFRGSLIDQEYKGISTIEIMNLLAPDVVTLGNHEIDYGVSHLLFIEKCARFPIINANMYVVTNHSRLFNSHIILTVGDMRILFIGILTEEVLNQTKQDGLIGSLVDVNDAVREVGRICNVYRTEDIDFTVLLTHIGFEKDVELAAKLDPDWGVDVIIGGHTHTLLSEPCVVNGIPVVQAATGTTQIGRFDITVDKDTNSIQDYTWKTVPITDEYCPRDIELEKVISGYKEKTDIKYSRIITRFSRKLTHPDRYRETELGALFADMFRDCLGIDIMLLGSGSIRSEELGPIVEYRNLLETFPYDDPVYCMHVTGAQLRRMITYMLRDEAFEGHSEFYQFSHGLKVCYSRSAHKITELTFEGAPLDDERIYSVGMQKFHFINIEKFLSVSHDELSVNRRPKIVSTSSVDIVLECMEQQEYIKPAAPGRMIFVD